MKLAPKIITFQECVCVFNNINHDGDDDDEEHFDKDEKPHKIFGKTKIRSVMFLIILTNST